MYQCQKGLLIREISEDDLLNLKVCHIRIDEGPDMNDINRKFKRKRLLRNKIPGVNFGSARKLVPGRPVRRCRRGAEKFES